MRTVLVCDDELYITRAVAMKLRKAGYDVLTAADGQAGLELALASPPDVVITDYQMPRMDGLELCVALKKHEQTRDIPVVLLTAKGYEVDEQDLKERFAIQAMIVKPFSPRELLKTVHRLIGETVVAD
ncbi:MAG: response regulator [Planctomycetota bacterium]|nr:MAG: response regulator [Planctomycetota bacterium]